MEPIKQEIVNNIYENGEQLITGPVLQEVLVDMVDDYNEKISSGSLPSDLIEKTGSWDSASAWVEDNKDDLVHTSDLEGYATEEWVEEQGYLTEHQDISGLATTESLNQLSESLSESIPDISGLATTESVNQLSESVAESIAEIPVVDLSGYATTSSVNEATESVKEWVEAKHYLTTASLSGSVTEETVGFMIGDATASVKSWVESQSYATETFVSESIAGISIPDVSGYLPTASFNLVSASFDERINAITGSDLSGYATTESLNTVSQSISQSISGIEGSLSDKAEARDLTSLSESVASDIDSLEGSIGDLQQDLADRVDWDTYDTERAEFSQSVASDITSLSESIAAITGSDLSGYATTQSLNSLSQSIASDFENLDIPDVSGYLTTASFNTTSASFDQRINAIVPPDLSTYATTASLNSLSQSVSESLISPLDAISALEGAGTLYWDDIEEHWSAPQLVDNQLFEEVSESFDQRIDAITPPDLSIYATTASVNSLSQSLHNTQNAVNGLGEDLDTLSGSLNTYATTSSVNSLSQSVAGDFEALGDNTDGDNKVGQLLETLGYAFYDVVGPETGDSEWQATLNVDMLNGIDQTGLVDEYGEWKEAATSESLAEVSESLSASIAAITGSSVDLSGYATTASLNQVSESLSQSIAAITASGADTELRNFLFGTGSTTESLNPAYASNWIWEISNSSALSLDAELGEGKTVGIVVHNNSASESVVSFYDEYYGPYSVVNGVLGSGSFTIPAGQYGDIVATQIGNRIYFRTSVDLSDIDVDLSGYATTASVNQLSASFDTRINSITGSGGDLSIYATTASVNELSESIDNLNDVEDSENKVGQFAEGLGIAYYDEENGHWSPYIDFEKQDVISQTDTYKFDLLNSIEDSGLIEPAYDDNPPTWRQGATQDDLTELSESVSNSLANMSSSGDPNPIWERSSYSPSAAIQRNLNNAILGSNASGALAQGVSCSVAGGTGAHAEGLRTTAEGAGSHAEGIGTTIIGGGIGSASHAEGYYTYVGWNSQGIEASAAHAEGSYTTASGTSAHSEGEGTKAFGLGSHAEGNNTRAYASYSHAEGNSTSAEGDYSHAEGWRTSTSNPAELATGRCNFTSSGQIFSVGDGRYYEGSQNTIRRNVVSIVAVTSSASSSVFIQGIGGYDGTNPQPGVNDIATIISDLTARIAAIENNA